MKISYTSDGNEPVTLTEAKNWLRLDSDLSADDTLIEMLIADARIYCENYTNRFFTEGTAVYKVETANGKGELLVPGKIGATSSYTEKLPTSDTLQANATRLQPSADKESFVLKVGQTFDNVDYWIFTYEVLNESSDQIRKCILNLVAAEYDYRKDGKLMNRTKINAALDQIRKSVFK